MKKSYSLGVLIVLAAGVSLLWLSGCSDGDVSPKGPALAAVGEEIVTPDDFRKEWSAQKSGGMFNPALDTPDSFLNDMVMEKLIILEARRQGIGEEPGFKQEVENFRNQLLVEKFLDREILSLPNPSEAAIDAYYAANKEKFEVPELIRVSYILISPEEGEDVETVAEEAKAVHARIKAGEDFAQVAKEVSDGPALARGGDLGFFRPGQFSSDLEEVAWSLVPGEVSDPIPTEIGYNLLLVSEKKEPRMKSKEEAKERIAALLLAQSRKQAFDILERKLKQKNPPVIDQQLLSSLKQEIAAASK